MRKPGLLIGCAAGALLAAAAAAPASAQSFNGTPTVAAGGVTVTTGVNTTTLTVFEAENVINWRTVDFGGTGAIDFQPVGTTATFQNFVSFIGDYTVLNRIIPVDAAALNPTAATITFNGTVNSVIVNNPGGHIWFYSPTGIIASPTAVFNVGSLILTTGDIPYVPSAGPGSPGSVYGPGGLVQIKNPAGSTGFVDIQPGAQLTAAGANNAYVALVAPRVIQGGLVQSNGQVAYLAAEQVDLTINGGLFDFVLTVGTTDPQGVVHAGTTTGPASTSAADLQRISMVALPKNTALTMMLSGSIGYTPAASAVNEGSSVVLAAGFTTNDPTVLPGNALGRIAIGNSLFRNRLTAYASDAVDIAPAAGTAGFVADARLFGLNSVGIDAGPSEQVVAAGNLLLHAGTPGAGGLIKMVAVTKGSINVAGTLIADASSSAAQFVAAPAVLDAAGGSVTITADGGTIGALNLLAGAEATGGGSAPVGGNGTGGTVDVLITNDGTLTAGLVSLSASARGGNSTNDGGDGTGGMASLTLDNGSLSAGTVVVETNGLGGSASASAGPVAYQSGAGLGGTSRFTANGGTANIPSLTVQSSATGGGGERPDATGTDLAALSGNGFGGTAILRVAGGALTTTDTTIDAYGRGADGMSQLGSGVAANGGIGTGGSAFLQSPPGATGSFSAASLAIQGNGQGGDGGSAASGSDGDGGNGAGGLAAADLFDGLFAHGVVTLDSTGTGGPGALGGEGFGGFARFELVDIIGAAGPRSAGSLNMDASGYGGSGASLATAASDAGQVFLHTDTPASISDPAFALIVTGDLTLTNQASSATGVQGVRGQLYGAPLEVGGNIAIDTARGTYVESPWGFRAAGSAAIDATWTAISSLEAGTTLSIVSPDILAPGTDASIGAGTLVSGGAMLLRSMNGPVEAFDLTAGGGLTVLGASVDVASPTALTLTSAQAIAGDLRIVAVGDLTAGPTQATGAVTLTSSAGAFVATSPVLAGGALALSGEGGITAGTATSGGTTLLQSANGGVTVTALDSAGAVTAQGRYLDLDSPGALAFADALATAGAGLIDTQGDLSLVQGSASGGLSLSSANGAVVGTGPLSAGNNASIVAPLGVTLASLASGGTTLLQAVNGPVLVSTDLASAGAVTALGRSIDLTALGALAVASAQATAGNLSIDATGDLTAASTLASGNLDIASSGGTLVATGPVVAGGALALAGNGGVIAGTVTSGGATTLLSANGGVTIGDLTSPGAVTALGRSVDITSPGALSFADLDATAGDAVVNTQNDLTLASGDATGTLQLTSAAGNVVSGDLGAGMWTYVEAAGSATLGNIVAGIDAAASAFGGNLTVGDVTAGDEIWLSVFGSNATRVLTAGNLVSTGLGSDSAAGPPALFGAYPGSAGPTGYVTRVRSSGSLALGNVQTPGRAILVADLGAIGAGSVAGPGGAILLARGDIALAGAATAGKFYAADSAMFAVLPNAYDPASLDGLAPVDTSGSLTASGAVNAGTVSIAAGTNLTISGLTSAGTTLLRGTGGTIDVDSLASVGPVTAFGRALDIVSPGAIAFADLDATAGALSVVTAGDLTLATADATGAATLRSTGGTLAASGAVKSGGALVLAGSGGLSAGTVNAGGTTLLQSANGAIAVTALTSQGAVTAQGRAIDLASPGALAFTSAQATAGGLRVATQGNLSMSLAGATGALDLSIAAGAFSSSGPLTAGGNASIVAPLGVAAASLTSGGATLLRSTGGIVDIDSLTSVGAVTALGREVDIVSPGALAFADLDATVGTLSVVTAGNLSLATVDATGAATLRSTGGTLAATGAVNSGGALVLAGASGLSAGTVNSSGTTQLQSPNGAIAVAALTSVGPVTAFGRAVDIVSPGTLAFADLDATAGALSVVTTGNLSLATADATGAATLRSTGGTFTATGAVNAGGALVFAATGGLSAGTVNSGGTALLQSPNGAIAVTALTSQGAVTAQGRSIDLVAPGMLDFAAAQATSGGLRVATQGNLSMTQAGAIGALDLSSAAGGASASGPLSAGGNASIVAPLGVTLASLASGGTTLLRTTGGTVKVDSLTSVGPVTAFGRAVDIASPGALTFADLDATAGALTVVTAGNLTLATADATGAVGLRSTGGALRATGTVTGGPVQLTAGGAVQADASVLAAGALAVDAGGAFTLGGLARGTAVSVLSNDIALGTSAAIGERRTTLDVTLTNRSSQRTTFVGGAAEPSGYSIDQAEAARVFADRSIAIAGVGDVAVRNLALSYGAAGQIGTGGRLEITTPARVSVTGAVMLATSGATDTFTIDPTRIELNTDTGSIALLGSNGAPLGRLALVGNAVAVGTGTTLGQLAATSDFTAINALLDTPGGTPQPLRAGTMTFNVVDSLYVQNSGPTGLYRDRAGFTASGVAINTTQPTTRVAINGQVLTPAGPLTGLDTQQGVTINGAPAVAGGRFDPGSTINGCVIGGRCAPLPGTNPPSDSDLVQPLPPDTAPPSLFVAPIIELADDDPLVEPPLVDEPITGIGNDDLWQPRCDPDDEACTEAGARP